tara:strand:+ start:2202 stop:2567 length:366 start_codon:yes stop_codon:yes gene_type:complete
VIHYEGRKKPKGEQMIDDETETLMFRALEHGIFLDNQTEADDDDFLINLMIFINERKNCIAFYENDKKLSVESRYMEPLYTVDIEKSVLTFTPLANEGFLDAFLEIFEFIDHVIEQRACSI